MIPQTSNNGPRTKHKHERPNADVACGIFVRLSVCNHFVMVTHVLHGTSEVCPVRLKFAKSTTTSAVYGFLCHCQSHHSLQEGPCSQCRDGIDGHGSLHFKGKNVVDCVATLHSILHFLGHCTPRSQTPPMLNKILVDAFLCCSNPVFVQYIHNLADFHTGEIDEHKKLFSKVQSGLLQ